MIPKGFAFAHAFFGGTTGDRINMRWEEKLHFKGFSGERNTFVSKCKIIERYYFSKLKIHIFF